MILEADKSYNLDLVLAFRVNAANDHSVGGLRMKHLVLLCTALIFGFNSGVASANELEIAMEEEKEVFYSFKDWKYCSGDQDVFERVSEESEEEIQVCSRGVKQAFTENENGATLELECIDNNIIWIANLPLEEAAARDWRNYEIVEEKFDRRRFTDKTALVAIPEMSSDVALFLASDIVESLSTKTISNLRRKNNVEIRVTNSENEESFTTKFSLAGSSKTLRKFMAACKE